MKKKLLWLLILLGVCLLMGAVIFAGLRWKVIWQPAEFEESSDYLENRERGFYNMRGVRISDESPVEEPVWNSIREEQNEETLELLQIHIGDYLDREISPSGLEQIRNTFQAYREKTKPVSLIVRVLYDWDGREWRVIPPPWKSCCGTWSRWAKSWRNMRIRFTLSREFLWEAGRKCTAPDI